MGFTYVSKDGSIGTYTSKLAYISTDSSSYWRASENYFPNFSSNISNPPFTMGAARNGNNAFKAFNDKAKS